MIDEGSDYVAANAVSSCYKKVDACIAGACKKNPLRCIEGTSVASLQAAQGVVGDAGLTIDTVGEADVLSKSQVNRYLRSSCADTIGSNKYFHMTFLERTPSKKIWQILIILTKYFRLHTMTENLYWNLKFRD